MTNTLHSSQQFSTQCQQLMQALNIQPNQWPDWQAWRLKLLEFIPVDHLILTGPMDYGLQKSPLKAAPTVANTIEGITLAWYFDSDVLQQQLMIADWWPRLTTHIRIAIRHCRCLVKKKLSEATLAKLGYQHFSVSRSGKLVDCDDEQKLKHIPPALTRTITDWLSDRLKAVTPAPKNHQLRHKVVSLQGQRWLATLFQSVPDEKAPVASMSQAIRAKHPNDLVASLLLFRLDNQTPSKWLTQALDVNASEAKVMVLFASGQSAESIADETGYSVNTIYSYIKKTYSVLGINKQSQLTACLAPRLI